MRKYIAAFVAIITLGGALTFGAAPNQKPTDTATSTVESRLVSKTAHERANIKADAIAKLNVSGEYTYKDLRIEIQSTEKIEGGVQVFVKAWRGNQQLGFGSDGSVEIERIRIFNPPILVPDGTKRQSNGKSVDNFKEDLGAALKESIGHTVSIVGKEHTNIVLGKVGNTTSTFYPISGDAVIQGAANATWSTARDATTGTLQPASTEGYTMARLNGANYQVWRTFQNFDTSAIPDTDTVSSAISSVYGLASNAPSGKHHGVYDSTAADTVVADDFNNGGTTAYSDSPYLDSSFSTSGYNDMTWNATGRGAVSKTGNTKISLRQVENDVANSAPSANQFLNFYNSSQAGTTNDPKLTIVHEAAATSVIRESVWDDE